MSSVSQNSETNSGESPEFPFVPHRMLEKPVGLKS
jgi:hypothetical protein